MGMPTAAKLFSAITFACLGYLVAHLYAQEMQGSRQVGLLREIGAMIGLICGWTIMGKFASRPCGRVEAMGTGIRTSFTATTLFLVTIATVEMVSKSLKGRYSSAIDAVLSMFEIVLGMAGRMLTPDIIAVLLLGGLFGGMVGHWAGRNWT